MAYAASHWFDHSRFHPHAHAKQVPCLADSLTIPDENKSLQIDQAIADQIAIKKHAVVNLMDD